MYGIEQNMRSFNAKNNTEMFYCTHILVFVVIARMIHMCGTRFTLECSDEYVCS